MERETKMKLKDKITIDVVLGEWLKAEWYKSYFDNIRASYSNIVNSPNYNDREENNLRNNLMEEVRPDVIPPLFQLPFEWQLAEIESSNEFRSLNIIPSDDWYLVTGRTFRLKDTPLNLHLHEGHQVDIQKKKDTLRKKGLFQAKLILVGASPEKLTIIEGNHRAVAYLLFAQEAKSLFLPLEVIFGSCPQITKYRWSIEWENVPLLYQYCEKKYINRYRHCIRAV